MDNFYKNCQPKMQDGRFLTDYMSSNYRENFIQKNNRIFRNDDYRFFLQDYGKGFMDKEWQIEKNKICKQQNNIHKFPLIVSQKEMTIEKKMYDNNYMINNQYLTNDYRLFNDSF